MKSIVVKNKIYKNGKLYEIKDDGYENLYIDVSLSLRQKGHYYYYIYDLEIKRACENGGAYDTKNWNNCNYFFTKEEAQKAIERKKIQFELRNFKLCNDNVPLNWGSKDYDELKWFICLGHHPNGESYLHIWGNDIRKDLNTIYFSTHELAKQAIEYIGEERILNAFK